MNRDSRPSQLPKLITNERLTRPNFVTNSQTNSRADVRFLTVEIMQDSNSGVQLRFLEELLLFLHRLLEIRDKFAPLGEYSSVRVLTSPVRYDIDFYKQSFQTGF